MIESSMYNELLWNKKIVHRQGGIGVKENKFDKAARRIYIQRPIRAEIFGTLDRKNTDHVYYRTISY